jgi:hypothetical protein
MNERSANGHVIDFETPMAKFHLKGRAGKKIRCRMGAKKKRLSEESMLCFFLHLIKCFFLTCSDVYFCRRPPLLGRFPTLQRILRQCRVSMHFRIHPQIPN